LLAASSSDQDVLFEIAQHANRKIAKALSENQNCYPEVLVEARAQTGLAYHEFVALERHKNYPLDKMTGEGAHSLIQSLSDNELEKLLSRNDVGDALLDQIRFKSLDMVEIILKNKKNKITTKQLDNILSVPGHQQNIISISAISNDRWPSKKIINKPISLDSAGEHYSLMKKVVKHSPNVDNIFSVLDKYKNTPEFYALTSEALKNKNISTETKTMIKENGAIK